MFEIRKEQLDEFRKYRLNKFISETSIYLRKFLPLNINSLTDVQLKSLIETGIQKAKNHEIESEINITRYIVLMIKLGEDFDNIDWAKKVLKNITRDQDSALSKLEEKTHNLINSKA